MLNGHVDGFGRALVPLDLRASADAGSVRVEAWVDTAFNGELVVSREVVARAGLQPTAAVEATLADGSPVLREAFECHVDWLGEQTRIEAIANEGEFPLLTVGMLIGRRVEIDYAELSVVIE